MALYVNYNELVHRICNGFVTHDGTVDGDFYDIYQRRGIDIHELGNMRLLEAIVEIMESMKDEGINLYPKEYRGERVRSLRRSKRISMEGLAKLAGMSKNTISKIERGQCRPRHETMKRIADILEVDVSYFGG